MIGPRRRWLEPYSWEFVTAQNALLCAQKNALHKPTSDAHEETRILWDQTYLNELHLDEAVDFCRRCHRIAPFCFYNGNTFTAIVRDVVVHLVTEPRQQQAIRSLAGHIVAGVASDEEERAFREFCTTLA